MLIDVRQSKILDIRTSIFDQIRSSFVGYFVICGVQNLSPDLYNTMDSKYGFSVITQPST